MMEIIIDCRMIKSSGIGTVIANVTSRLIARNPGWTFHLLGHPKMLEEFPWTKHAKITAYTAPIYSVAEQTRFPVAAVKDGSVLWSPNYNFPQRWKGPLIVTVHDLAHLALPEMRHSIAKQIFARLMFRAVKRRARDIAYVSQFTANEFHRLVGKPRGVETVIHCGVDESWFGVNQGTAPDRPYILFVGNVKPHKNLRRLLEAFGSIKGKVPHDLLIVGRKEGFITGDSAVLEQIAHFDGRVKFTGYISDTELKQTFASAGALVLPSLYEGFGLTPVEAMAAGCPTLVSRAASLPEVCQDAALYCDPLDCADIAANLLRIVTDPELRSVLKSGGVERAHQLSWDATTATYETLIRKALV